MKDNIGRKTRDDVDLKMVILIMRIPERSGTMQEIEELSPSIGLRSPLPARAMKI